MTLSDFGVSDCPGGVCEARFPPTEDELQAEIASVRRQWAARIGPAYAQGNPSFLRDKVLPLLDYVDPVTLADQIGANAVGWAMHLWPGLILVSPMLQRWPE